MRYTTSNPLYRQCTVTLHKLPGQLFPAGPFHDVFNEAFYGALLSKDFFTLYVSKLMLVTAGTIEVMLRVMYECF